MAKPAVLLDDVPAANIHNGSRVKFGPDRLLYVTFGDVAVPSNAQDVAALNGKILRFNADGTSASGNRFNSPVYSFGHRNPQGLAWHPITRDLWETEHGQTGNDEINVIDSGVNYGWPVIEGAETRSDMATPLDVLHAVSGAVGRGFLHRQRHPGVPQSAVRRDAQGAWRSLRVTIDGSTSRHVAYDRAFDGGTIRAASRRRDGTGRVSLHLHEQPRRAQHTRRGG